MRFRWSYYYDDLDDERRRKEEQQQHPQQQGTSSSSSTLGKDPSTPSDNALLPSIPYLVYPSYAGDILAIDYHAAAAAAAASTPHDVDSIAHDQATYAAEQARLATRLIQQQRDSTRRARAQRKHERRRRRAGSASNQAGTLLPDDDDDDLVQGDIAADRFDSISFLPSDLLPQAHGPPLPPPGSSSRGSSRSSNSREAEANARRRAAAIVRLGAGTMPSGWTPPPPRQPRGLFPSLFGSRPAPKPYKPIAASMPQRMAALGVLYSLGIPFDNPNSIDGITAPYTTRGSGGSSAADPTAAQSIWTLSHSAFSAWFPPPYRVLTLVALGILVFAADVIVLSRLGIDPVPFLFPASAATSMGTASTSAGGARLPLSRVTSVAGQGHAHLHAAHGLGPGLGTARQLARALLLLGAVYTLIAFGGWASFRTYVDSALVLGDPAGRHAQALQGLAVGLALGLACWPGRVLFRPVRYAFWAALGRLLWPRSSMDAHRSSSSSSSRAWASRGRGGGGGGGGADEGDALAEEADRYSTDEHEPLTAGTGPSRLAMGRHASSLRARLAHQLRRAQDAVRDTRRWFLPPTFSAVILADVLTSFAKVFADVWLTACFLVPRKEHHTWWNGRGSVVVPILTSLPYLIRFRQCVSEYLYSSSSSSARAKHTLSATASHHTGSPFRGPASRKPLWNALKYFSALPVIWLAALEGFASSELAAWEAGLAAEGRVEVLGVRDASLPSLALGEGVALVRRDVWAWGEEARWRQRLVWRCWLFWVFFNSLFSFWWDVTHDWGLDLFKLGTVSRIVSSSASTSSPCDYPAAYPLQQAQTHHRRGLSTLVLRPASTPLLLPAWAYHVAVGLDLVLRFTWSIKLSSQLYRYADWEGGVFVLEALEIVRRGAWVVLRFEHAALHQARGAGAGAGAGGGNGAGEVGSGDDDEEEEEGRRALSAVGAPSGGIGLVPASSSAGSSSTCLPAGGGGGDHGTHTHGGLDVGVVGAEAGLLGAAASAKARWD